MHLGHILARPRPADALSQDSVRQQLDDLRAQTPAVLSGFDRALASFEGIGTWSELHLHSFAPDLSALGNVLRLFARPIESSVAHDAILEDAAMLAENADLDLVTVPNRDNARRCRRTAADQAAAGGSRCEKRVRF